MTNTIYVKDPYKIVSSHTLVKLQEMVNEHIRDGWQPLGAPFPNPVTSIHDFKYCQALIRSQSE